MHWGQTARRFVKRVLSPQSSKSRDRRRARTYWIDVLEQRELLATDLLFDSAIGLLAIHGDQQNNIVIFESADAQGFVQLNVDGAEFSSNAASANYSAALAGATASSIQSIQLVGGDGFDELRLQSFAASGPLTVQGDESISITGSIAASSLELSANDIAVTGSVGASTLGLHAANLLEIGAGSTIAGRSIDLSGRIVDLGGTVAADGAVGGAIHVSASSLLHYGTVSANGSAGAGGEIVFDIDANYIATTFARASADGTIGGLVKIEGNAVFTSGAYSAVGSTGVGGTIQLLGDSVTLVGATANASGATGGGKILVGGDYQGSGGVRQASTTTIDYSTNLVADALGSGAGGRVIVWSTQETQFFGSISARGITGPGGFVEVSSHEELAFGGVVAASSSHGAAGTLLLDPKNIVISSSTGVYAQYQLLPGASGNNGNRGVTVLSGGNTVVGDSSSDFAASDAGAVYLFNGSTGVLISMIYGTANSDAVGSSVTQLSNGNYVVRSANWDNGTASNAGAVTWGSGSVGVSGAVSATNSLVGTFTGDQVGFAAITQLSNGNYVVAATSWDNGTVSNAGAVTWGSGTQGVIGAVSATNSLVGSSTNDGVGAITALTNGNYVVVSQNWDNGTATNAGAVTWGSGTQGVTGAVSAANSLVGTAMNDQVGISSVTALSNGNYVVASQNWNNGTATSAGAVTWGSGSQGVVGAVSSSNSLVGSSSTDQVGGNGVQLLSNGNYVVRSASWRNGTASTAGAVSWGNGTQGISGVVSSNNSLVGSSSSDQVGASVTALSNGNYLVVTSGWDNGTAADAGAVTWGSGTQGVSGTISSNNSLVGSRASDGVGGSGMLELSNGNYFIRSNSWDLSATATDVGAVTWGSGTQGISGVVSSNNSLVGSAANDQVGATSVTALANGNYVIVSRNWDNGTVANTGAVTWGSGTQGVSGFVSATNSLVGTSDTDLVGRDGVVELTNGNYVVKSSNWDNGTGAIDAGAVTWGDGTQGVVGAVTATNSLIGVKTADKVGLTGVQTLTNGNYVVRSSNWDNGTVTDVGAVTWSSGTQGIVGAVSATNSLIGSSSSDQVGSTNVTALTNGNYVVQSNSWKNGTNNSAGAVTWGNGTQGIVGEVSSANSLVGTKASDQVGSAGITALANGNYVVRSSFWDNGTATDAGAATWGDGTIGVSGIITSNNSLVGSSANDGIGAGMSTLSNSNYVVISNNWDNGTTANVGSATWSSGTQGSTGVVSAQNSVVGTVTRAINQVVNVTENTLYGTFNVSFVFTGQVSTGFQDANPNSFVYGLAPAQTSNLTPAFITATLNAGTAVILQANNDITVNSNIIANNPSGNGGNLTLQAGRSILLNANITTDSGNLTLIANDLAASGVVDAYRDPGAAVITMNTGTSIDAGTGTVSIAVRAGTGNTNITSGDITLEAVTAATLSVANSGPTAGSDIVGNGAITVSGTSTFAANSANDITLSSSSNDFATVVITSGNNVSLQDANAIVLGASTVSGTLGVTTSGAITQSGALAVIGTATFAAGSANDITLANSSNDFSTVAITSGNNVSLQDANAIALGASTVSGTLGVTTSGAITQSGVLAITGTATFAAGSGNNITLANSSNDFSTVAIANGNNISLQDANAIVLGASTFSGTFGVATSGAITQSGALAVIGTATFAAGSANDITLANSSNDFSTVAITSGNNVSLQDANAMTLATSTTSGLLTLTTVGTMTIASGTTIAAGGGFTKSGAGSTSLSGNIDTSASNGAITFNSSVTLGRDVVLNTGNAATSFLGGTSIITLGAYTLTTNSVVLGAGVSLAIVFDHAGPDSQIIVAAGTITLNNNVLTGTTTGVATGDSFVLFDNQPGSAVSGQFSGGSSVTINGTAFTISYTDGGNDIVLSVYVPPPPPPADPTTPPFTPVEVGTFVAQNPQSQQAQSQQSQSSAAAAFITPTGGLTLSAVLAALDTAVPYISNQLSESSIAEITQTRNYRETSDSTAPPESRNIETRGDKDASVINKTMKAIIDLFPSLFDSIRTGVPADKGPAGLPSRDVGPRKGDNSDPKMEDNSPPSREEKSEQESAPAQKKVAGSEKNTPQ